MWQELIRSLAALIKVKTIVTLVVIGVFAAPSTMVYREVTSSMRVVGRGVACSFGTQSGREDPKK